MQSKMLNQVYNILFGGNSNEEETMQSPYHGKENRSSDDDRNDPRDFGTLEDVEITRRKRGRPPKTPTSNSKMNTPASNKKQRQMRTQYQSENSSRDDNSSNDSSDLSESGSDNDSNYKHQKSRKKGHMRKKQRSIQSHSTIGTPSHAGLSFAESVLKSATRRSNRGRQIDLNKELIVLMPGDDPREKLDLRNDAEWELFQTVMLEDYAGAISDGETHGHHSHSSHYPISAHNSYNNTSKNISQAASKTDLSVMAGSTSSISHIKPVQNETGVFETEAVLVPGVRLAAIDLASLTAQLRHQEALSTRFNINAAVPNKPSSYSNKMNNKTFACPVNYEDVSYYEIELDEEDEAVADALFASNNESSLQGDIKVDNSAAVRTGTDRQPTQPSTDSKHANHFENEERVLLYGRETGGSRLAFRRVFSRLLSRLERELMYRETLLQQSPPLNQVLQQTYAVSSYDTHNSANYLNGSNFKSTLTNINNNASATSAVDVYVNQRHLQWLRKQSQNQVRICQSFARQFHLSGEEKLNIYNKIKSNDMDVDEATDATTIDDVLQSLLHQEPLTLDSLSLPSNPNPTNDTTNNNQLLTLSANRSIFPSIRREASSSSTYNKTTKNNANSHKSAKGDSASDEEDDTISERFRALRQVTATQLLQLIGEDYALQLLCELRPRMFPACPSLPINEETALNKAILSHWVFLRTHTKQSLLRAFHVFVMPLWCLPLRAVLPQPIDYPLSLLQTAYHRLQHIQQDLDRARLIVDRVRRREKLKKELLKQTSEQWQQAVLGEVVQGGQQCLGVAQEVVRQAMSHQSLGVPEEDTAGPGHRDDTSDSNIASKNHTGVEEKRKRGRPRRIDSNQSTPQVKQLSGTHPVSQSPKNNAALLTRDRFGKFLKKSSAAYQRHQKQRDSKHEIEEDEGAEDEEGGDTCATHSDTEDEAVNKEMFDDWKVPGSAKRLFTLRQWMPFTMKDVREELGITDQDHPSSADKTEKKHMLVNKREIDSDEEELALTASKEENALKNKKKKGNEVVVVTPAMDVVGKKSGNHTNNKKIEDKVLSSTSPSPAKKDLASNKLKTPAKKASTAIFSTPVSKSTSIVDKTDALDSGVRTRHQQLQQQTMTPTPLRSSSRHKR